MVDDHLSAQSDHCDHGDGMCGYVVDENVLRARILRLQAELARQRELRHYDSLVHDNLLSTLSLQAGKG